MPVSKHRMKLMTHFLGSIVFQAELSSSCWIRINVAWVLYLFWRESSCKDKKNQQKQEKIRHRLTWKRGNVYVLFQWRYGCSRLSHRSWWLLHSKWQSRDGPLRFWHLFLFLQASTGCYFTQPRSGVCGTHWFPLFLNGWQVLPLKLIVIENNLFTFYCPLVTCGLSMKV